MKVCSVWYGDSLSYLEALSLTSAMDVGHEVDLYAYDNVKNIPNHVNVKDARDVMPVELMLSFKRAKSPAIGADIFRMLLQKQSRGCYIDCDMVLLKPLPDDDYVFGWERADSINNAVFRLPADSPVLADMLALAFSRPVVPPWLSPHWRLKQRAKWLFGKDVPANRMQFLTFGPLATTYYVRKHGLADKAKPQATFFPVPYGQSAELFTPGVVPAGITANTIGVHMWNSAVTFGRHLEPLEGSWIKDQCRRLGVADPRWTAELRRVA